MTRPPGPTRSASARVTMPVPQATSIARSERRGAAKLAEGVFVALCPPLALRTRHQRWIGDVERGVRNPGYLSLVCLARALGVTTSQLIACAEHEAKQSC